MRASARGQALVELALGVLVFITVLMFGIHFAEVGYMSLRVHEAAVSPLWDATALRVHQMEHRRNNIGNFSSFPSIAPQVKVHANGRFKDFDGRRSTSGGTVIRHVFTQLEGMQVQCEVEDRVEFDVPRSQRPGLLQPTPGGGDWGTSIPNQNRGNPTDSVLDGIYENLGGVACAAEARIESLPSLPAAFLEGANGFFQEQHSQAWSMKVCAVGRPAGPQCKGRYAVLLGDFAFADTEVSDHCPLRPEDLDIPCPENRAFYYAAMKVFDNNERSAGQDATAFADFFAGYSPIDERGFFMSYRGVEDNYLEDLTPPGEPLDEADRPRNTGGVDQRRPSNTCYLGLDGC
ncbi:MAG: pilus assembly protein [Myxococcaceae bacterium]|nr:pilus assembly protein [Myxococcaceae bacterium]